MVNLKDIKCHICGNMFKSNRNAYVCSKECKKVLKRQYYRKYSEAKKNKEKQNKNLEENLKEAEKLGLSYGKYIAIRDGYLSM